MFTPLLSLYRTGGKSFDKLFAGDKVKSNDRNSGQGQNGKYPGPVGLILAEEPCYTQQHCFGAEPEDFYGDLAEGEDFFSDIGVGGVERGEPLDPVERFMRDIEPGMN